MKSRKKYGQKKYSDTLLLIICLVSVFLAGCVTAPEGESFEESEIEEEGERGKAVISEVMLRNDSLLQTDDGNFPGWIELTNTGSEAVSLKGISIKLFYAESNPVTIPAFSGIVIEPGAYKLIIFTPTRSSISVPATRITTKFYDDLTRIELRDSSNELIDSFSIPEFSYPAISEPVMRNISYIRDMEFLPATRVCENPTPGMAADVDIPEPVFKLDSGFYDELLLEFLPVPGFEDWEIRYTINDGISFDEDDQVIGDREWIYPTNFSGTKYTGPVPLAESAVIKARFYSPTGTCSNEVVRTYFVGEETELPVFSIAMDPKDMWDSEVGIYTIGSDREAPNFMEKWFRKGFVEFFGSDDETSPRFSDTYLLRTYGSSSKYFPQKSLAMYAREPASTARIPNEFFTGSAANIPDFYSIILRSSGGDNIQTMFRDGLMTRLTDGLQLDRQDFQPAVVFINGQYWGILNIREKINEYFIEDHHGVAPDDLDLLEGTYQNTMQVSNGSVTSFDEILFDINHLDAAYMSDYKTFMMKYDLDNLMDYSIIQLFYNNLDWPWSNVKYWRSKSENLWRWILFDLDAGFQTEETWTKADPDKSSTSDFDYLDYELSSRGRNNIFSLLLRNLLRNKAFYEAFFNRYSELLDTVFIPERVTELINAMAQDIYQEMERHQRRWSTYDPYLDIVHYRDMPIWNSEVEKLIEFAETRPGYVRQHIEDFLVNHPVKKVERIQNGDFSEGDNFWNLFWSKEGTIQEIKTENGNTYGEVRILQETKNVWDLLAFVQDNIRVCESERISISIDLKTNRNLEENRYIEVAIFDANTNQILLSELIKPDLTWTTYTSGPVVCSASSRNYRLQIRVGTLPPGQEIFLDNIELNVLE